MRHEGDPLSRYRKLLDVHTSRVGPRLDALRRQVDTTLGDIARTEQENLRAQAMALAALRKRIASDARFLLHDPALPAFVLALVTPPAWMRFELGERPGPDPSSWQLAHVPHGLSIDAYKEYEELGYEDEHDCIREMLSARVSLGPVQCVFELERARSSLFSFRKEADGFCQYHELAFQIEPALVLLSLDPPIRSALAHEVSCLICYTLPVLRLRPAAVDFTYP